MKITLLNLPHKDRIMRRYMCSFNAPNFLFCPQELIYVGTLLKKVSNQVKLIDAIAENLSFNQTIKALKNISPDYIISIIGFECFEDDIKVINKIKKQLPNTKIIIFGHYPTLFPKEIFENSKVDIIIRGEPDLTIYELLQKIKNNKDFSSLEGIAYRKDGKKVINPISKRILNLNKLPIPDRSLLKNKLYYEPFLGKPYTTIQTTRGCPYSCNYCVKTFGKLTYFRNPENILMEIKDAYVNYGIRNFRFIDDTFTTDKKRVQDLCKLIIQERIKIKWTCLSRIDTLDRKTATLMKKAGCKRIYLGIESGSQKIINYYNKNLKKEIILPIIKMIHKAGIETIGWFMVGSPDETDRDLEESVKLAKKSDLDFVVVSQLIVYPGTPLFEKLKDKINFSLFPYKNEFKDKKHSIKFRKLEQKFYKSFYFRIRYIPKGIRIAIIYPKETLSAFINLFSYTFLSRIKKDRKDFY